MCILSSSHMFFAKSIKSNLTHTLKLQSPAAAFSTASYKMAPIQARAVIYSTYGEPADVLQLHTYEIADPKDNEVVISTIAAPINPSDINQIQGVYPSKPKLSTDELKTSEPSATAGNEGLFKVVKVGPNVKDLSVGDWCIPSTVNFGTWRSHALTTSDKLFKMPKDRLSVTQAATITVNPSSAYQMLNLYVDMKPGDWFIQNAGNSQVGMMAIQIGKKLGLNSISIVRDRENLDELKSLLTGLGATHVITEEENEDRNFGKTVKEWTGGKPIRLGLNSVGGSNCTAMARKLGQDATLLTYGGMSMKPVSLPTSLFIFKNLTAKGFWVTENIKRIPGSREDTINALVELMESGDLVETPHHQTEVSSNSSDEEFFEAFKQGLKNSKNGKQLIKFE